MSITTYAELQTAIARWVKRSDLDAYIPDFITLAESRFYNGEDGPFPSKPLRLRAMQDQETNSITNSSIAFPANFIEVINLSVSSGGSTVSLRYKTPAQHAEYSTHTNVPSFYTFIDNAIKVVGTGGGSYTLDYYKRLDALSDSNTSNALLAAAPNVYLWGGCLEAAIYTLDDDMAARFMGRLAGAISALQKSDHNIYGGGSLAVEVGR